MATQFKYLQPVETAFVPQYATPNTQLLATSAQSINNQVEMGRQQYDALEGLFDNVISETSNLPEQARAGLKSTIESARENLNSIVENEGYRGGMHAINKATREFAKQVAPYQNTSKRLSETMAAIDESSADYDSKMFLREIASSGIVFDDNTGQITIADQSRLRDIASGWKDIGEELDTYLKSVREKPIKDDSGNIVSEGRTPEVLMDFALKYVSSDPQLKAQMQLEAKRKLETDPDFINKFMQNGETPEEAMRKLYEISLNGKTTTVDPMTYHIISKANPYINAYSNISLDTISGSGGRGNVTHVGNPPGNAPIIPSGQLQAVRSQSDMDNLTFSNYGEYIESVNAKEMENNEKMASYENKLIDIGVSRDEITTTENGMPSISDEVINRFEGDAKINLLQNLQEFQSVYVDQQRLRTTQRAYFNLIDPQFNEIKGDVVRRFIRSAFNYDPYRGYSIPITFPSVSNGTRRLIVEDVPEPNVSVVNGEIKINNREEVEQVFRSAYDEALENYGYTDDAKMERDRNYTYERISSYLDDLQSELYTSYSEIAEMTSDDISEKMEPQEISTYLIPNGYKTIDPETGEEIDFYKNLSDRYRSAEQILLDVSTNTGSYLINKEGEIVSDMKKIRAIQVQTGSSGSSVFSVGVDADNTPLITGTFLSATGSPYTFVVKNDFAESVTSKYLNSSTSSGYILAETRNLFTSVFTPNELWGNKVEEEMEFGKEFLSSSIIGDVGVDSIKIKKVETSPGIFEWKLYSRGESDGIYEFKIQSNQFNDIIQKLITMKDA